jgi:transcriptional regulator with XRE-family HTH domain
MKDMRNALGMTQTDLAQLLGVGKSSISNIENGRAKLTYDQMATLTSALRVNPRFLLDGTLPILLEDTEIEYTLNEPTTAYGAADGLPLVTVNAQSAYMNHPEERLPRVVIPGVEDPESRVFEVSGDYMYPVICNHDYVICSRIAKEDVRDGELCVVVSRVHGVLVGYVRMLALGLRCYPANKEDCDPFTVSYRDLRELWVVKMRITQHVAGNHLPLDRR